MKYTVIFMISVFGLVHCSKTAQITNHKLCFTTPSGGSVETDLSKWVPSHNPTVPLYKEASSSSEVVEQVAVGTVVKVIGNRNANVWNPTLFVQVQTDKNSGYMNPKCFVVDQDPASSVYNYAEGKVANYSYFYDPSDKKHYPKGYTYSSNEKLPKDKVPLSELVK
jgi:hypothetical protein